MDSRNSELAMGAVPSMSDRDFDALRGIVREVTGIVLADSKRTMLASRLVTRLRRMNLSSFSAYREALADPGVFSEERQAFINAVTTNKTSFFREPHQFEVFAKQVIPEFVQRAEKTGQRRIRIWSAACSTGEEPWTLSMVLRECLPSPDSWDVKILASDIDTDVLAKAAQGHYDTQHIDGLSRDRIAKHFTPGRDGSIVVNKVEEGGDNAFGFNALTHEYGDLLKMGVIVPTKVERVALQNAASIAALLLTTEAAIVEIKEKKKSAGGHDHSHDDMDY